MCVCAHIYIYIERERERYLRTTARSNHSLSMQACFRRRENTVGVNMVLAKFGKFKDGLHKSCGTECFEGTMLEPCLLQPCFHVAGVWVALLA